MKRIIGHWTAGNHTASDTDKRAYYVLIEGIGKIIRGVPSIDLNSGSIKNGYAAHTLNCNTDSIGLSMCCMAGAIESPFSAGRAPLTAVQWSAFVRAVAEHARFYQIPVTPQTILFHAEVQANLCIAQRAKWDVIRLPFEPSVVGAKEAGDKLRREVAALLAGNAPTAPQEPVPAGGIGRITAPVLNTRNGPNGDVTGSLKAGTLVEVNGLDGVWLNVTTPAGFSVWCIAITSPWSTAHLRSNRRSPARTAPSSIASIAIWTNSKHLEPDNVDHRF
ncbi:N-acetylmuramoyl-L-alanine amidase [Aliihoeflea aestuarii]|uniref:N-acetylmuramoyl-L-alanine amidase n=1 Tax=Aliihoeflea aestuarii TaxID=453840 RepID=UPI00209210A6|nr:N-acetylmuramoyl-L-alanine amidase [Aliihoeflea aestuarii]